MLLTVLDQDAIGTTSHALINGRAVAEFEHQGKADREIDRLWHALLGGELHL